MKKFEFTLERLKNYREQLEEQEKNDLAALRAEREIMIEHEQELIRLITRKNEDLRVMYQKGAFPNELTAANRFLTVKKQELELQRLEILRKEDEIEHKLEQVVEAKKEVKKLEKLEEKQLEEYHALEQKENEKFIEEFFGAGHEKMQEMSKNG